MKRVSFAAWGILGLLYAVQIYILFTTFDVDFSFGYFDHQLYWQTLHNFLEGKTLYNTMFWEYSLLPIFIRIPFFLLLGKSFFATIAINFIILPLIGIILSFIIGKQILNKKALFLFGVLLLLYQTNIHYSNIRYLIPELGLVLFILGMEANHRTRIISGSIILGFSLLTSLEYAIASHIAVCFYFLAVVIRRKFIMKQWIPLVLSEAVIGMTFLFYLLSNNALQNMIQFHREFVITFYSESPCQEIFPRINKISALSWGALSHWNYYFVPLFILGMMIWTFYRKNFKYKTFFLILMFYSMVVSYRTITTPCYYTYGLTFPFLILTYSIFQIKVSKWFRIFLIGVVIWFFLSSFKHNLISQLQTSPGKKGIEKEFLPVADIYLSKKLAEEYKAISTYIQTHTTKDEYIYSYRVGPYNQLTGRKSPVSIATSAVYEAAPFLVELTVSELQKNQPSYVIINTYNGDSPHNSINNIKANIHFSGNTIFFEGEITDVEKYIAQNYELVKVYDIAWILKRRTKPIKFMPYYVPISGNPQWSLNTMHLGKNTLLNNAGEYTVTEGNPTIYLFSPEIKNAEHMQVPIKVNLGISKNFSKYSIGYILLTNTNQMIDMTDTFVSSEWGDEWIYIPRKELMPEGLEIIGVALYVSDNLGFIPWGKPEIIELADPSLYRKNPQIGQTVAAYKKAL